MAGKAVASGFFLLPEAENVSAVIFNANGTLSNFNRTGIKVGFDSSIVRVIHAGERAAVDGGRLADAHVLARHTRTVGGASGSVEVRPPLRVMRRTR